MKYIAHRGNIDGPAPQENDPVHVRLALARGFDAEVDAWYLDGRWYLGHDGPGQDDRQPYRVDIGFLQTDGLWIHCKNYPALQLALESGLHCFYHADDDYTLTSRGYVWAYPGHPRAPSGERTICVLPELTDQGLVGFAGVCSDWVRKHRDKADSVRS